MSDPKADYIAYWRDRLAGMALSGLILPLDKRPEGPFTAGKMALELPAKIDKLLAQLFDDAVRRVDKPLPPKTEKPKEPHVPPQQAQAPTASQGASQGTSRTSTNGTGPPAAPQARQATPGPTDKGATK